MKEGGRGGVRGVCCGLGRQDTDRQGGEEGYLGEKSLGPKKMRIFIKGSGGTDALLGKPLEASSYA